MTDHHAERQADLADLLAVLAAITRAHPDAVAAYFHATAPSSTAAGFRLTDIVLPGDGSLHDTDPRALQRIAGEVSEVAAGIAWRSVMHEDRGGFASLRLPDGQPCALMA